MRSVLLLSVVSLFACVAPPPQGYPPPYQAAYQPAPDATISRPVPGPVARRPTTYNGVFDGGTARLIVTPYGSAGMARYAMTFSSPACPMTVSQNAPGNAVDFSIQQNGGAPVHLVRQGAGYSFSVPQEYNPHNCSYQGELKPGR